MIEKFQLAFFCFIHRIHPLHEMQYIILLMTVSRQRRSYRDYLTQTYFKKINIKKKIVVQKEENKFIRKLLLKFALVSSLHTFRIHTIKNHTIGSILAKKIKKESRLFCL